jgi:serine/threonine-protein kinase RsbW
MDITGDPNVVELTLPASPRHATVARLVASSLAADAGFDVDEIDDVRLGINEAIAVLTEHPMTDPADCIQITFSSAPGRIEVRASRPNSGSAPTPDDLAVRILSVVVDEHSFTDGMFRLVKLSTSGQLDDGT